MTQYFYPSWARNLTFVLAMSVAVLTYGSPAIADSGLPRPWLSPQAVLVLDPYWGNEIDLQRVKDDPKIVAIIHKATEGVTVKDKSYADRRHNAKALGFLWGSYHFGRPGHVSQQVEEYLSYSRPTADEVIALDVDGIGPAHMSLDEARQFVLLIKARTGRYPLLYASPSVLRQRMSADTRNVLSKCPLWYVRMLDRPIGVPAIWASYTLWQFSSEIRSVYRLAGADPATDVNFFQGSADELRQLWPFTRAE
jgi:lysozyme